MRYRLMATYLGVPYHAGLGPAGTEATLFSPGPPPDELGFVPAGGHWRKQVNITDLGSLWQSRVVGEYRGEPCLVLDDLGDRLHIAYQGRDSARARQLGYWEIDREVFEVVVARQDITGLTEERVEYPLDSAMFPASNRDPVAQPRPGRDTRGRGVDRAWIRGGGGAPAGATGCPSPSLPNFSAWPPSRTWLTLSTRRCQARCAWSRPTVASRYSAGPTTRGWTCAFSRTRKRPTSICSASWRPRRCAAAGCGPARSTGTSTARPGPEDPPAPPPKTFRRTYRARSY